MWLIVEILLHLISNLSFSAGSKLSKENWPVSRSLIFSDKANLLAGDSTETSKALCRIDFPRLSFAQLSTGVRAMTHLFVRSSAEAQLCPSVRYARINCWTKDFTAFL